MRQWLVQRRTWTVTLACWTIGMAVTIGLAWHAIAVSQSPSWGRPLLLCGIWIALGGCARDFLRRRPSPGDD